MHLCAISTLPSPSLLEGAATQGTARNSESLQVLRSVLVSRNGDAASGMTAVGCRQFAAPGQDRQYGILCYYTATSVFCDDDSFRGEAELRMAFCCSVRRDRTSASSSGQHSLVKTVGLFWLNTAI